MRLLCNCAKPIQGLPRRRKMVGAAGTGARKLDWRVRSMLVVRAAVGFVLLLFAKNSLLAHVPTDLPRLSEIHFEVRLIALAFALSLITGITVRLEAAPHASRTESKALTLARSTLANWEGYRAGTGPDSAYTRSWLTTSPSTSVSRKSRPWNR